jgi:hypothetical protein
MRIVATASKPTYWQLVFSQSKVNGGVYAGDLLERHSWAWPKNTYFQRRLDLTKRVNSFQHAQRVARF